MEIICLPITDIIKMIVEKLWKINSKTYKEGKPKGNKILKIHKKNKIKEIKKFKSEKNRWNIKKKEDFTKEEGEEGGSIHGEEYYSEDEGDAARILREEIE